MGQQASPQKARESKPEPEQEASKFDSPNPEEKPAEKQPEAAPKLKKKAIVVEDDFGKDIKLAKPVEPEPDSHHGEHDHKHHRCAAHKDVVIEEEPALPTAPPSYNPPTGSNPTMPPGFPNIDPSQLDKGRKELKNMVPH